MRKVIASEFVSLDGAMEEPRWTFQFSSAERRKGASSTTWLRATPFCWGG